MKIFCLPGFLFVLATAHAFSNSTVRTSDRSIAVPGTSYVVDFSVRWTSDDYPQNSAPGRIELLNSAGSSVAQISASVYRSGDISVSVSGPGSVANTHASIALYASNGTPADGQLSGTWTITGLSPGNYTLRLYSYTTWDTSLLATTVRTTSLSTGGYAPAPKQSPTITWTSSPGVVESGQSYIVSARGHDGDGNLTAVSIWKNGQPFAFAGGGNGTDGDSQNPTHDTGPSTVTFTAQAFDTDGQSSAVITQTVTVNAPNRPPTIAWTASPGTVASNQSYTIAAQGHDPDGNLSQVSIWKNGQPFATTTASGADGNSTGYSADTGPQTITFTAQALDTSGATSNTISHTVAISAPPPAQYTLTTKAGAGGSVTAGGTYTAGTVLSVSALPDGLHDFAGWSGDAGGTANPVSVTLDRNKTVQANFTPKLFALVTSTNGGGSITPGGIYPAGSWITISASPDATHKFTGWTGDASGTAGSIAIYLDRSKAVQAGFVSKAAQIISFAPPGDHPTTTPPFSLNAVASSGLPVSFALISGPATLNDGWVQVTGPGAVIIQATQPGDADYLPAAPVNQTFYVITAVSLKYHPSPHVLLNHEEVRGTAPLILEQP